MTLSHRGRRLKGARFEVAVAAFLRDQGFPEACRQLDRRQDSGDVILVGPVGIECKDQVTLRLGVWMTQAKAGAERAGKPLAVVVHKRRGVGDVGQSYVTLSLVDFTALLRDAMEPGVTNLDPGGSL